MIESESKIILAPLLIPKTFKIKELLDKNFKLKVLAPLIVLETYKIKTPEIKEQEEQNIKEEEAERKRQEEKDEFDLLNNKYLHFKIHFKILIRLYYIFNTILHKKFGKIYKDELSRQAKQLQEENIMNSYYEDKQINRYFNSIENFFIPQLIQELCNKTESSDEFCRTYKKYFLMPKFTANENNDTSKEFSNQIIDEINNLHDNYSSLSDKNKIINKIKSLLDKKTIIDVSTFDKIIDEITQYFDNEKKNKIKKIEAEINELEAKINELEAEKDELNTEKDKLGANNTNPELKDKIEKKIKQIQDAIEPLTEQIDSLTKEKETLESSIQNKSKSSQ